MRRNLPLPVQTLYINQDHLLFLLCVRIHLLQRKETKSWPIFYLNTTSFTFCISTFCTDSEMAIYPKKYLQCSLKLNVGRDQNMMRRVQSL